MKKPLESQSESAYKVLRAAIANLELGPDERLSEALLADRYGFGRTPIREAVHRLRHDGFVISTPRRGLVVSSLTQEDIREIYEMLEALDGLAAYLAAERATDDQIEELRHLNNEAVGNLKKGNIRRWQERNLRFHQTLVDLVGNRRLHDTFDLLYSQLRRALLLTLPLRDEFMPSMQAHTDILVAIQNGDAESARSIAQEHRRQVRDDVIAALGKIDLPNMRY